jgi:DNA-binding response OmpR family regulator
MVVDDDPDILVTLGTLFEEEGFEVVTAENGLECLKELEKGFRGIILLDIMMPVLDGWDTIKHMTLGGYMDDNVVIVILTARRIPDKEMEEFENYIQEYITKPFDIKQLIETVKKHSGK